MYDLGGIILEPHSFLVAKHTVPWLRFLFLSPRV